MRRLWPLFTSAALVVVLDAAAKVWARNTLHLGESRPFIPGLLQFTLTTNTGGAFGIASGSGALMILLPVTICSALIYWVWRRERSSQPLTRLEQVGFGMLIGGAVGNIIDRVTVGKVTDFLEFTFINFPVFNVADALIDVGIGLLLIASFLPAPQSQKNE